MSFTLKTSFIILVTLCVIALLKLTSYLFQKTKPNLPPGPPSIPVFENLHTSFSNPVPFLRTLYAKYDPMITLKSGSRPAIFIFDRSIAYQALVQSGSVFSNRPNCLATTTVISSNMHTIISAGYGPNWRLFRRNLTSEMLHPARVKSFAPARKRVLQILLNKLVLSSKSGDDDAAFVLPVRVVAHFQYAIFSLLVFMCFGDKVDDNQLRAIKQVQNDLFLSISKFKFLNLWPTMGKFIFKKSRRQFYQLWQNLENVFIPLIKSRQQMKDADKLLPLSYVDTLLDLQLPEEGNRKLDEQELVSLCSEFLIASIYTTSTALQWIMANIVKYPDIQNNILQEIIGAVKPEAGEIKEEDLGKLQYLKAVILEVLRRHPPVQLLLPHSVSKDDVTLNGFSIPKNATINFMVQDMGRDPNDWEDPMAFKPERFFSFGNENGGQVVFDAACTREIKMMPFGAGRRMCPGYVLAKLHLEYFVANLVWRFKWAVVDGEDVDLSEKQEFTSVMKNPLQVQLSPRV